MSENVPLVNIYQYEQIPYPDYLEKTRVLTLAPGNPSDPLVGSLSIMSTLDPHPFEALSYVWGRITSWDSIICDGKSIKLTANLGIALRRLRHTMQPRVLWVDQICINQMDLTERSQQVKHMNSIYRQASKVLVWLGEDDETCAEMAFSMARTLARMDQDPELLELFKAEQKDLIWFPPNHWIAFGKLFRQPWFDRKWILQEIGTDANSELIWGTHLIDWEFVYKAATLLKDHGYALRRKYDLLVWKPWYMYKLFSPSSYKDKELNFVYELHRARWQLAGNPRDHIYALLGHPAAQVGPNQSVIVEPDYTKSVEDVYHQLAVQMLQRGESLMILNVVQHESIEASLLKHNLPTWVPQWDNQTSLYNLLGDDVCIYRPSKDILPSPKFLDSEKILALDGVIIDTVGQISDIILVSDFTLSATWISDVWHTLTQHVDLRGEFTTAKKYRTGEPTLFALLETISAVKKRRMQDPIPISKRLADATDYLVKVYDKSHEIGADITRMSQGGDCYQWMDRASGGSAGRKFVNGKEGYFALCPPAAREGDKLCFLVGGQTLFCLRPSGEDYLFVGECYVHGLMEGEALDMLDKGDLSQTTFMIR